MLDYSDLRVPRRARFIDLYGAAQMHSAAMDPELPGISRALTSAIDRAEDHVSMELRQDAIHAIERAFRHARVNPEAWAGALTVAYGAMLACFCWKHVSSEVLRELTWRWDLAADDHLGASTERVQLRELGAALGLA